VADGTGARALNSGSRGHRCGRCPAGTLASLGCRGHVSMMSPTTGEPIRRIAAHKYGPAFRGPSSESVGPAFAHGCHDLGELGVERESCSASGSARDEGASIAGYAPAQIVNSARRGDVRQRVTDTRSQVPRAARAAKSPRSARGTLCRISRGRRQGHAPGCAATGHGGPAPGGRLAPNTGPRIRSIRARQQSDPPRIGSRRPLSSAESRRGAFPATPSRGRRSQPACLACRELSEAAGSPATAAPHPVQRGRCSRWWPRRTDQIPAAQLRRPGPCPARLSQDVGHHIDTGGQDLSTPAVGSSVKRRRPGPRMCADRVTVPYLVRRSSEGIDPRCRR